MKKIQIITILAGALFASAVQAQTVVDCGSFLVSSNALVTNLTVGTISIDCSKQQNIAVEWTVTPSEAGVTAVQGIFMTGIAIPGTRASNLSMAVGGYIMRVAAATGPTPVVVCTNFNVAGFSRLDVTTISNVTSGAVEANFTNRIRYTVKRNAP